MAEETELEKKVANHELRIKKLEDDIHQLVRAAKDSARVVTELRADTPRTLKRR